MAIKDRFWDETALQGNILSDYALGLLAQAAYQTDPAALERWALIFQMPLRAVVLTPGILIPNFVIAGHADRLIVAIPGTQFLAQMLENVIYSAHRENPDFGPGRMHSFFLWCAEGIVNFVRDRLAEFPELTQVTFIGHSLGGAVAQLLADWTVQNTSITVKRCIAYNCPRVGGVAWARRTRPYQTVTYYSTRDMCCELPLYFHPKWSADVTPLLIVDDYLHRGETTPDGTMCTQDSVTPIPSANDILLTWWAAIAGKIGLGGGHLGARTVLAETSKKVFENTARISGQVYFASWFLPLPVWIDEHRMCTMNANFQAAISSTSFPEKPALKNLHTYLGALEPDYGPLGYSNFQNSIYPYPLIPPMHFREGASFGSGRIEDLPSPVPGTRSELIEAAFEWEVSSDPAPLPALISVDDSFLAAFAQADAVPRGQSPLTSPTPIDIDVPFRPHWLHRGTDRRLLEELEQCLDLIEKRDLRAWDETPTSSLSTREQVFDFDDDELQAAVAAVRGQVTWMLGLEYGD